MKNILIGIVRKLIKALSLTPESKPDGGINLSGIQHARKQLIRIFVVLGFAMLMFHQSTWPPESIVYLSLTRAGVATVVAAIAARVWIRGHLGYRRLQSFVSDGPYSVVRHPLYLSSMVGTAGIGAQSGSIIMMFICLLPIWVIFNRVAQIEEVEMLARFGQEYESYLARTPRFIPRFSQWAIAQEITTESSIVMHSFRNSSNFALSIPIFMAIEWAQRASILPVLLRLP